MEVCGLPGRFPAVYLRQTRTHGNPSIQSRLVVKVSACCRKSSVDDSLVSTGSVKSATQDRMFILGMGFVGKFFAQSLKNDGWVVSGTCTNVAKKEKLEEMGLNVHVFNADEPKLEVLNILNQHTHLLISIPPRSGIGDQMLRHDELLRRILNNENLRWLCYLSTTGVYGDSGGAWVDEDYPPNPPNEIAKLRLAAEEGWLKLGRDLGLAAQIFRLGGIYGPGRSAIDTILKQKPLSEVQSSRSYSKYTIRIHVADICNALNASLRKPSPGRIYNIVDDDPAPRTEVFSFAHDLIEVKWPSLVKQASLPDKPEPSMSKRSSGGEKRVSNARMKEELGVSLLHPTYRSGLQSIIDQMHKPCNS